MLARRLFSSSTSSTFPQSHFGQPVYFRTAASFFFFFSSPDLDGAGAAVPIKVRTQKYDLNTT